MSVSGGPFCNGVGVFFFSLLFRGVVSFLTHRSWFFGGNWSNFFKTFVAGKRQTRWKLLIGEAIRQDQTNTKVSEAQLVALLKARNASAFDVLYREYAPGLLRRLHRMTGSPTDAEECLQQVFAEVIESIDSYRGDGVLGAWLNRIATHVTMNLFRKKSRWKGAMESLWEHVQAVPPESASIPETVFLHHEHKAWVRSLIDELPPKKRIALIMCDLEGWSQEDAAAQLDVPVGTLVSRLYHGRLDLRRKLERESLRQGISLEELLHE